MKVGDLVRVRKNAHGTMQMVNYRGKAGKVISIEGERVEVLFRDGQSWFYRVNSLILRKGWA